MSPTSFVSGLRAHRADYTFIMAMGLLLVLGLIIIYSISPVLSHKLLGDVSNNHFLFGQLLHISLGLVGFGVAASLHHEKWQSWLNALIIGCGLALLLMMIPGLGVAKNGATRWVELGPLSFQPSELIKFTLVLFLASRFSQAVTDNLESRRRLKIALGITGVIAIFVLFAQRDMGTMLIMVAILVGQFFASGVRHKDLGILLTLGGAVGVSSIILFPHRIARLLTYLDPSQNISTSGYHLNQALIAIGSGGFLGLGIGKSIQVYGYLPEAANDSIFAIIAETLGFLGSLAVIGLFILLLHRGFKIAKAAPSRYAQLLVLGIMLWVGTQAVINMTAMLGIIPLTGVPLPFLSYGGTSLVMIMTAMGIVVNVSKYTKVGAHANRLSGRRDGRTHYAYPNLRPRTPSVR